MEKTSDFNWPKSTPHQVAELLDGFLNSNSLPHAHLFIGKDLAQEISNIFANRIISSKADLLKFDAADADGVESVRELLQLAALMPVSGQYKVVAMYNMELANTQMLNALLKTLEEPPSHTVLVLQSVRPLISTVMSRSQVYTLMKTDQSFSQSDEITEALQLLEQNTKTGTVERIALVAKLANLDDTVLLLLVEAWMYKLVKDLRIQPQKHSAVRNSMETLQALKSNFNKKMVLQNFVVNALV